MKTASKTLWGAILLPGALSLGTILLLRERGHTVFDAHHMMLLLSWIPVFFYAHRRALPTPPRPTAVYWPYLVLVGGLTLYLFSSVAKHNWFYFFRWFSDPPSTDARVWWFTIITVLLIPWTASKSFQRHKAKLLWAIVFISLTYATVTFFRRVGLGLILKDDHPAFAFRLWELRHVPFQRVNYNPWFNGGLAESHPQITGTHAPFYLLMPLWTLFPVERVYTLGFAILFLWIVPLVAAVSVRWVRGDAVAQATAALLAQGVSLQYYLWLLHFGTLGACLTAAMLVPVTAVSYRLVVQRERNTPTLLALTFFAFLTLCYPPGLIMCSPLVVSMLLQWRRWTSKVWVSLLVVLAGVALLHSPSISAILRTVDLAKAASPTARSFIPTQVSNPWSWEGVQDGWVHLLCHLKQVHPLLLFAGLIGLYSVGRHLRAWYAPLVLLLAWLTGWGRLVFPGLQLTRMAIPLAFSFVVPAAVQIGRIFRLGATRHHWAPAICLSLLILTSANHVYILRGRSFLKYFGQSDDHRNMVNYLASHVPADMRVLFAGKTVHAYGGGHVAVIPALTQREILACDYYHFDPAEVEYEYPPRPYRASREGLEEFFDMYNVGLVITYHDRWKDYFAGHPDLFVLVQQWGDSPAVCAYRLQRSSNGRVWKGQGTATAKFNEIRVTLDTPGQTEIILGYNWTNGLTTEPPAELFPFDTGQGIVLIGVRPNGLQEIVVRFVPSLAKPRIADESPNERLRVSRRDSTSGLP